MLLTDLADLAEGTDISLDGNIPSVLRDVRHYGEVARVYVPPARLTELGLGLAEGRFQVARPAERALERLDANDSGEQRVVSLNSERIDRPSCTSKGHTKTRPWRKAQNTLHLRAAGERS